MGFRPRLNIRCARCGKPREGLRHVCRSNSARRATIRIAPVMGDCPRCGKPYGGANGNPLTHACRPKTDFKTRKATRDRTIRAAATAKARTAERDRQRAILAEVRDRERRRSRAQAARLRARYEQRLAAAKARAREPAKPAPRPRRPPHDYMACPDKECQRPVCIAYKQGYQAGYGDGYSAGFAAGLSSCPGPHTS